MSLDVPISRIMTANPVTIGPGARVSQARALLIECRIHHLPVVRGRELVGIVTSTDMRRYGPHGMFSSVHDVDTKLDCYVVAEVMTAEPVTVTPEDHIHHAAELFRLDSFSALPIVDGTDLVGIVTAADVLGYLIGLLKRSSQYEASRLVTS